MDTHGDRGALDLGTVKSFMYQLLRVRAISPSCVALPLALRPALTAAAPHGHALAP